MSTWKKTAAVAMCLSCIGVGAHAEYITNGGFETGDLSGWTLSGETTFLGVLPLVENTGTYGAYAGPQNALGFLSQSFAAPAGQTLDLSLFLNSSDNTANRFEVIWNGTVIDDRTNIPADLYTRYSYVVSSAGTNTFTLGFLNPSTFFYLDDVSAAAATSVGVPEPATLALLGTAALGMAVLRRRQD